MGRINWVLIIISLVLVGVIYFNLSSIKNFTSIVVPQKTQEVKKEIKRETSIILAGDVMLGRKVMITTIDSGDNLYPFRKVGDTLREADLVFVNLENPITKDCKRHIGGFTFCAPPQLVEGLTYAGIDVVTLANNHTSNYGVDGINQTKAYLRGSGIEPTGVGELVVKEVNGVKYGFLGFDWVFRDPTERELELISESNLKVDVLIVGIHWGVEYKDRANEFQRKWAREVVSRGGDIISGHHPHWVQDVEYIEGVPVFYSLGNFVFDQQWSEETKKGMVVKLTFDREGKIIKEERLNTYMADWGQPEFR